MGLLVSKLFSIPQEDRKLEACLVDDAAHITPGSRGDHVKKIQIALNQLSNGKVFLIIDGSYGRDTADAVKAYKDAPSRQILQPWQTTADDIVGKRTIKSLDDEMDVFENESDEPDPFVATTHLGSKHDHDHCPFYQGVPADPDSGPDGRITHIATPVNPQRFGRMICIGGAWEVKYLGFEDFVPDPKKDPSMKPIWVLGRPFTNDLKDGSVSDICFRSAPIDKWMREIELPRICALGCRLTWAGGLADLEGSMEFYLASLGPIIHHVVILNTNPNATGNGKDLHVVVVQMLLHKRR